MEYLAANETVLNRGAHGIRTRILNDQWISTLGFCMDTPTGGTYFAGKLVFEMVEFVKEKTKGGGRTRREERRRLAGRIASLLSPTSQYPEDFRQSFDFLASELLPPMHVSYINEIMPLPYEYFQDILCFANLKNHKVELQEAAGTFLAKHQDSRCSTLLRQGYERLGSIDLIHAINQSGRVPVPEHFALLQRVKNGSYRRKFFLDSNDLTNQTLRELISRSVGLRFPFDESRFVGWDFLPNCRDVSIQFASSSDWRKMIDSVQVRRFDKCSTLELDGCSDFNFKTISTLFPAVETLFLNACRHFSCDHLSELSELSLLEFRRVSHPISVDFNYHPTKLVAVHFNSCNSVDLKGEPLEQVDITEGVIGDTAQ
ncbi:hypothetical protein [Pararhodobacter sp. SW119]|uniref:hypothetical protein n=1 Tax=Pararhodobacter sp. SW119 TaxID=2780075 RepID=UPI001AE015E4|nr:hypothetical protein [Pararhodobacter sp. SW119]